MPGQLKSARELLEGFSDPEYARSLNHPSNPYGETDADTEFPDSDAGNGMSP